MRASELKKQYLTTTGVSASQVVEKLEGNDSPEARAIQRQVIETERVVIDAGNVYDAKYALARDATELAKTTADVLSVFITAGVEIARVQNITAITSHQSLDRDTPFKFAEHLEKVFSGRGQLGLGLAEQLRTSRLATEAAERQRLNEVDARDSAERSLAGALMKLRGVVETARAVLLLSGVDVAVPRAPRKKVAVSSATPIAVLPPSLETAARPSNSDEEPDSNVG